METVEFRYSYSDDEGAQSALVHRKSAQMEDMTDAFLEFFASVFCVDYDFAVQRITDQLATHGKPNPSLLNLKRAAWDVLEAWQDWLQDPTSRSMDAVESTLSELGEHIPAERP